MQFSWSVEYRLHHEKMFIKFCWPREKLTDQLCVWNLNSKPTRSECAFKRVGHSLLYVLRVWQILPWGHYFGTFFGNVFWEHSLGAFFEPIICWHLEKEHFEIRNTVCFPYSFQWPLRVGAIAPTLLRKNVISTQNFEGKGYIRNDFGSQVIRWPVKVSTHSPGGWGSKIKPATPILILMYK